jgi:chromosome segregation ATPase
MSAKLIPPYGHQPAPPYTQFQLLTYPLPHACAAQSPPLSNNMSTAVDTLESLQVALEPLGALQSEQAELGSWIHDSFTALEKLHAELTQWQSELARKETELDLRQDALSKAKVVDKDLQKQVTLLEQQLATARVELQQLEEENGEQLRELENLEARYGELEHKHGIASERVTELEAALAAERERSASECDLWRDEFHELRGDLEKYHQLLAEQVDKVAATVQQVGNESHTPLLVGAAHAKSAELRRRAQSRREAKERKDQSTDSSEE